MPETKYWHVRDILGNLEGARLKLVMEQTQREYQETGRQYICLVFDNGSVLRLNFNCEHCSFSLDGTEFDRGI